MTQKKGGAVKAGGAKAVAGGHNVAKGGFQKAKAGALQSKAFLGKKELVPKGKAGSPQVAKPQQKAGARGNQSPRGGKNGKAVPAKKGKVQIDEDEDDDEDEDEDDDDDLEDEDDEEEDMDDDDDNDDEDDDDEELSDEEENAAPKKGQQKQPVKPAATPKSILKKAANATPQADEKVPKLVPIATKETPKGDQQAAQNGNTKQEAKKAAEKPTNQQQKVADDAFKLIANVDSEPLTAAQRGEFETRVRRFANATVFIKGLHRRCTEDDLRKLVKDVITIRLPIHEKRGTRGARSRGYAFLEFKDEATARRNVDFLNKEAKLNNSEGQACKLEASISAAGGYVMAAEDWNVGSLYVSGVPNNASEDDLSKLFDREQLVTVVLPRNRFTGATRGCAHIRFRSAEASIQQFDAARAKLLRGEFSLGGQALTIAFSSRQILKRERADLAGKAEQKPVATDKKVAAASKPAPAPQNQTPKAAAASNTGASATKAVAKATPSSAAANKSLNESVAKKGANDSIVKKQTATPVPNSAQKGATKRKLEEESARKAKIAKREEEEDDEDEDDDEDVDDDEDDDEDDE